MKVILMLNGGRWKRWLSDFEGWRCLFVETSSHGRNCAGFDGAFCGKSPPGSRDMPGLQWWLVAGGFFCFSNLSPFSPLHPPTVLLLSTPKPLCVHLTQRFLLKPEQQKGDFRIRSSGFGSCLAILAQGGEELHSPLPEKQTVRAASSLQAKNLGKQALKFQWSSFFILFPTPASCKEDLLEIQSNFPPRHIPA